jgi:PEP-CTERM motif-containing protein
MRTVSIVFAAAVVQAAVAMPSQASPITVHLEDTYVGGGGSGPYVNADSIGGFPFTISSADIQRPTYNTLQVVINTDFAGQAGQAQHFNVGNGALFISPGAWNPQGAPGLNQEYASDIYHNQWLYAVTLPTGATGGTGSSGLYDISAGTVVMSNVNNDPNNPGFYFHKGQAVQFDLAPGAVAINSASWTITPGTPGHGTITFNITDDHLLGDFFAISWAMTCANDIIEGQINIPQGGPGAVPEPTTWAMMIMGFAALGIAAHRRKRRDIVVAG